MKKNGLGLIRRQWAGLAVVAVLAGPLLACTPSAVMQPAAMPTRSTVLSATGVAAVDHFRRNMLESLNRVRTANGAGTLRLNRALDDAAQAHAEDMARHGFMAHVGSDGSGPAERLTQAGYRFWAYGENVAQGQTSIDQVISDWMNSPSHRDNMLDPGLDELGVGYAEGPARGNVPGFYWAIELGRR